MRMNRRDIKDELLDNWDSITEDDLHQYADSAVPVYYSDIIKDWQEMPNEYNDRWQEMGIPEYPTITKLMAIDLFLYYYETYVEIYNEIRDAREDVNY